MKRAAIVGSALALLGAAVQAQYTVLYLETSQDWGMVVADFNNDGHDDLYITGHDPNDRIWYWTPTGYVPSSFVFANSDRHDCDAADVNGDGRLDLYCAVGAGMGQGKGYNELWLQDTGGAFHKAGNFGAQDIYGRGRIPLFFDLNHDGKPDIYISNESTPRSASPQININRVFVNQGSSKFVEVKTLATGQRGFGCVAKGDVNQDGWDDLIVCNGQKSAHVYINNQANDFTELAAPAIAGWRDAQLVDINGDGLHDLVLLTSTNHLQIWFNTGTAPYFATPAFDDLQSASSKGLTVGDFDHDGRADVYVVLARDDCNLTLHDLEPDVVYWGEPSSSTWVRDQLPQDFDGCGHQAGTVDGDKVLLANGVYAHPGPNYLINWGESRAAAKTPRLPR